MSAPLNTLPSRLTTTLPVVAPAGTAPVVSKRGKRAVTHWKRLSMLRDAALVSVAQDALPQRDGFQIGDIPFEGHFSVGAAVDIFEQEFGQPPPRQQQVPPPVYCMGTVMPYVAARTPGRTPF